MKYKISKEDHEKLSDEFKGEYTEKDGEFILTVEGGEDTGALKRAKDHEKNLRVTAEDKLRGVESELETRENELVEIRKGAVPKDDVEALENSYKEKNSKLEEKYKGELDTANTSIKTLLVDNVAKGIASEISTAPDLLVPIITARLGTDTVDGKLVTRVLDKDGKLSALTIEELTNEIKSNKSYAAIITAGNGKGGGATPPGSPGGGAPKPIDWNKSTPEEKAKYIRESKIARGEEVREVATA